MGIGECHVIKRGRPVDILKLTGWQIKFIGSMLDLSQAELAARVGVSQPTIYRMEMDPNRVHESIAVMKIRSLADENLLMVPDHGAFSGQPVAVAARPRPASPALRTATGLRRTTCRGRRGPART